MDIEGIGKRERSGSRTRNKRKKTPTEPVPKKKTQLFLKEDQQAAHILTKRLMIWALLNTAPHACDTHIYSDVDIEKIEKEDGGGRRSRFAQGPTRLAHV
jgi:hypothetical protein